jgi:hypothetical protein
VNTILKKKSSWISLIAATLIIATAGYFVGTHFFNGGATAQLVRTVKLQKKANSIIKASWKALKAPN